MYCSLDKIDLAAKVDGRPVAVQTDHRTRDEIEAEPELSALYAMARVLNARSHLVQEGHATCAVHYAMADAPPALLRDALRATGAVLERRDPASTSVRELEPLGDASEDAITAVADEAFAGLARRAAARVGTRDLAIALRMLEDQTLADPPQRSDEHAYWSRVLELAALAGELLRAKFPATGRWVPTDRALVPFGFEVSTTAGGSAIAFPTNRAQRVIDDGPDESLFKLLLAADETTARADAANRRLMPSLRDRRDVELDEVVWQALVDDNEELPIVVVGIDGENTFGMIRRDAIAAAGDALDEALRNLASEPVQIDEVRSGDAIMLAVSGSFYAAEKLLDRALLRELHRRLGAELLAAAVPARGVLLVSSAAEVAWFGALARERHAAAGGRAISPAVMLVSDGEIAGFVK